MIRNRMPHREAMRLAVERRNLPFDADLIRTVASELKELEGPLLPILHALNDRFGHVDRGRRSEPVAR